MTWARHSVLLYMVLNYYGISWSLVYWLVPALHVYVYLYSRHRFLFMFSDWFQIYYCSFNFLYVTWHSLYLYAWTTSLNHVHMWLPEHANWLYHMYKPGCFLTTLDPYVQILEHGLRWPYYSWSEGAAEAWISGCHRSPFLPAPLLIGSRDSSCCSWAPLSFWLCLPFCISYFCILWWCNIL